MIPQEGVEKMAETSGYALKNGRKKSKLGLIAAALKMHISDRQLRKYEKNEIKRKDPNFYAKAMKVFNDENIGYAYLEEDPVYKELYGDGGDNRILERLLRRLLTDGEESLLERLVKKLKAALDATLDEYFGINKPGFA